MARRNLSSRAKWLIAGGALVVVIGGLLLFQPWLLFVNTTVNDALPEVPSSSASATPSDAASTTASTPSASSGASTSAGASATASPTASPSPDKPVVLRRGTLVSHEHETTGTALIVQLPDGSRILRLQDLTTASGPQVEVWLSDQPVIEGRDGWFVFKDGNHVNLGDIKGNLGNQNYSIPANVDLDAYPSVTLWCARFFVSFGAAELKPV